MQWFLKSFFFAIFQCVILTGSQIQLVSDFLLIIFICLCVCVCVCRWLWRLELDIRSFRAGITGGFEPLDVRAGNWMWVCPLRELNHLSSPHRSTYMCVYQFYLFIINFIMCSYTYLRVEVKLSVNGHGDQTYLELEI